MPRRDATPLPHLVSSLVLPATRPQVALHETEAWVLGQWDDVVDGRCWCYDSLVGALRTQRGVPALPVPDLLPASGGVEGPDPFWSALLLLRPAMNRAMPRGDELRAARSDARTRRTSGHETDDDRLCGQAGWERRRLCNY